MNTAAIRDEALLMLEGKGAILEVARTVSKILEANGVAGAVIGGVAVVLHKHVRTTLDVDVWIPGTLQLFADHLTDAGFIFDSAKHEFRLNEVPVHLVTMEQTHYAPQGLLDIEKIRTVSLADLLNLKLSSGTRSVLRSQDIADVIGLIRANKLTGKFAPKIAKQFRKDFRNLLQAVARGN